MQKNSRKVPKNLLVARFSALGDVAMTIPVVYSACRCNPSTHFVFLTKKAQESLFINPPSNLTVVGIDFKKECTSPHEVLAKFNRLIREYDIDGFADLHGVLRSYLMRLTSWIHGVKVHSIRKGRAHKHALTRRRNKVMLPLLSSRARYREVFFRFGLALEEKFDGLYGKGRKGDPALFAAVTPPKTSGDHWLGIAPFAKHTGKIYPPELMEKVVGEMSTRTGIHIFLFGGGEKEQEILDRWAATYPNVISLAGKRLGFAVELALLSHIDALLTMDSANMHLGSLVGTRVVSVWGATHPYCGFKGWRQKESDVVQLPMTCRPCSVFGNKPCIRGDYHCMRGIPPQLIINRLDTILYPQDK